MAKKKNEAQAPQANKDEQIGFHKGALSTLAKEREEMIRILQIVEQLMQMHIKGLKELGVDLEKAAKEAQKKEKAPAKPIEDILR
jgi:hypothetical protein